MDSTDKLIDAAVSQYAPSENVKKSVFEKIMKKVSGVRATNSDISIVYVSKDAKKLLNKIFSKNERIFRKLSKIENEIFQEVSSYNYLKF